MKSLTQPPWLLVTTCFPWSGGAVCVSKSSYKSFMTAAPTDMNVHNSVLWRDICRHRWFVIVYIIFRQYLGNSHLAFLAFQVGGVHGVGHVGDPQLRNNSIKRNVPARLVRFASHVDARPFWQDLGLELVHEFVERGFECPDFASRDDHGRLQAKVAPDPELRGSGIAVSDANVS